MKLSMALRVASMQPTIFSTMTQLAIKHEAVNLGQGFPDFDPPDFIRDAAIAALRGPYNQYAPGMGHLPLRQALAKRYTQRYHLNYDPQTEILVTVGATEALFATMMGLLDPGDEVILFEPCFDSYHPAIDFAGGVARSCVLRPPDWQFSSNDLENLISPRTKLLLLNSPQNPCGKVFCQEELELIAALCIRHDLIAVTDEVYEFITFDGHPHIPLASLPGMRERTLTISSLAKTFSVTGWKVGWASGPAELIEALLRAKQFITYCGAAPLQMAGAKALESVEEYYLDLAEDYRQRRDFLYAVLRDCGMHVLLSQGTYYLMVDISALGRGDDVAFCRWLTTEVGVAAIPASPFYADPADGQKLVRFAFCKSWPILEEAARRLRQSFTAS
ncbi:aminotransferase class I/II-fold pyridoxal phosphate-dependent enzyme [Geopsychrobacter electrodiphilus]|uniref:aminotransferase class I/II-fold pyridoxal phosphate-dependent enzyme n=1 Tax=Geopsychrobacter electrodiphilus TaxID=225196 RepID=UPI0003799B60|nr:aminotransferase class I/II-fold pyridoxal phosphate-dependent enzyme [Geopsychrobacter electrodiphilus]